MIGCIDIIFVTVSIAIYRYADILLQLYHAHCTGRCVPIVKHMHIHPACQFQSVKEQCQGGEQCGIESVTSIS